MSRKLTKNSVKPVIHYVKVNVNSGYYKWYHFTLDHYNDKPSFQGGTAYDLSDCYMSYNNEPMDEYAMNLETGDVVRLSDKATVMTVDFRS